MIKFIDVTGKTEDEAIQSALAQLKMDRDDVSVEILERAKAGFLGIGSAPARVRVSYDDGKAEEVKPVEKPAAPKPEKKVEPASAPKAVPMYAPEVLQKKESRANDKPRTERGDRPAREDRRENRAPRAERAERPAPQPKPIVDLGEECHDEKSEQIRAFLKGLLEHMDSAAEVKVYESEKGRYKVFLEGEKLGALIGRRGETLDAIQQLTNYSINHPRAHERLRAPRHPHRAPGYAECDNVLHRHRAEPPCGRFVRPHQGVIKGGHSLSQKRMAPFRSPKRKVYIASFGLEELHGLRNRVPAMGWFYTTWFASIFAVALPAIRYPYAISVYFEFYQSCFFLPRRLCCARRDICTIGR